MDYKLQRPKRGDSAKRPRIRPPPRPQNLRRGGGRKDSPGWTEQKRKTNRIRFHALRPFIQTAVTVWYPTRATPAQLSAFNNCNRNFAKENRLHARSVWEGPGFHQHIALGCPFDAAIEAKWRARLERRWLEEFGEAMLEKQFLWKPEIEPEKIASYLSKTRKDGGPKVKTDFPWLTFNPVWETGFRSRFPLKQEPSTPRKKSVSLATLDSPEKEGHAVFPHYTVPAPEKERGTARHTCPVCWTRWGQNLWAGSCKCSPDFPDC